MMPCHGRRHQGEVWAKVAQDEAEAGLDAGSTCEDLGLDRSYLADAERGKRNISAVKLEIIARGFRLSLSKLLSQV